MFRKILFTPFLLVALVVVGSIAVVAQTQTVGGKVELKKEDGTKVPFEGATIDCYRIDIKQSCRSFKTDSKGQFTIIGLPFGAKLIFAISGEGIAPQIVPNIRMDDSNAFEVLPGDGTVISEDEARETARAYASQQGELTDAQKEELAELEKKRAEIEAKNAQAINKNALYDKFSKEGSDAYDKKDYELAAQKYEEGYQVDPEYMGSAPVFLNRKAEALLQKALVIYNTAVKAGNKAGIETAKATIVKDYKDALTTVNKSYEMTTKATPAQIVNAENHKQNTKISEKLAKSIVETMVKINLSLATYIADENDAKNAVKIYQDTLKILPGDPDVMSGLALSLYLSGEFLGSKEQKQQSLNYWAEYKKIAPKDHSQQAAADEFIEILTTTDNLKAQKIN